MNRSAHVLSLTQQAGLQVGGGLEGLAAALKSTTT